MSQRDSSKVAITELPKGAQVILTGDRPTGPMHIGHYYGSLRRRVQCQDLYKQYVLIADVQALTDHADNPGLVRSSIKEVMCDYLAVGIDPAKSTIYLQSAIPETTELTLYYLNLINLGRLSRNPTVKTEIKQKGFGDEIPVGFLIYPVNQAADITQFQATLVPVGPDQIPMIEVANDMARAFNRTYSTDYFVECSALIPESGLSLPGTDGSSKMSKTLGNTIYLKDDADTVAKKVKGMYTDPGHIHVEDPGKIEGNAVFAYLDVFDPDQAGLQALKEHYQRGGLGDGVVKKRLTTVLNDVLTPIRERRRQFEADETEVLRILKKGTERAREKVCETMAHVRSKLGMGILDF